MEGGRTIIMEGPGTPCATTIFNGLDIIVDPSCRINLGFNLSSFNQLIEAHLRVDACKWELRRKIHEIDRLKEDVC